MREIQMGGGRRGLCFERFGECTGLRHVFTTRGDDGSGNVSLSGGRDRVAALAERRLWCAALGVEASRLVVGSQVHGIGLRVVGPADRGRGALDPESTLPRTDGLLTLSVGVPLLTAVADCVPVLLFFPGSPSALGSIHAGWRGLRAGILPRAVHRLCALCHRPPAELWAGIGPCIGPLHYEVGEEVAVHAPPAARLRPAEGRPHVDLARWAEIQLLEAGLAAEGVERADLDTAADPRFFSHRGDGPHTGRMALLSVLRGA